MIKSMIIILSIAVGVVISCGDNASEPFKSGDVFDRINIQDNELSLQSYVWRDFMPPTPEGGKSLYSLLLVHDCNANPIIDGISADQVWLYNGERSWSGALNRWDGSQANDTLYYSNHEGPKWEPGDHIDIYVEISFENETYILKQADVIIDRTE